MTRFGIPLKEARGDSLYGSFKFSFPAEHHLLVPLTQSARGEQGCQLRRFHDHFHLEIAPAHPTARNHSNV